MGIDSQYIQRLGPATTGDARVTDDAPADGTTVTVEPLLARVRRLLDSECRPERVAGATGGHPDTGRSSSTPTTPPLSTSPTTPRGAGTTWATFG